MRNLVLILILTATIHAATLSGDIYSAEGSLKLNNTIIKIEGPISTQTMANEKYTLELPEGTYDLTATHYKQGKIDYIAKEHVRVNQSQTKFDLVLIPYELYSLTPQADPDLTKLTRQNQTTNTNQTNSNPEPKNNEQNQTGIVLVLGVFGILAIAALGLFFVSKNRNRTKSPESQESEHTIRIDEDYVPDREAREVLKRINDNEGRIYQKELRDSLNWSEAKMSITIAELEKGGCVKRIRKGRDNLLKVTSNEGRSGNQSTIQKN
ncbi:hypothetical protein HY990_07320 [Candidatus Micrarchaeota archaeon]|nr:hypothetical protein [Candidatus Micrarchaeota archaeon]